jgi:cation diffusion facilitator family transporter
MRLKQALVWLGFGGQGHHHPHGLWEHEHRHDGHASVHSQVHDHTHGAVAPILATTARGIWAIKWSFVVLGVTAALQLGIVGLSGSVALLADTIHNVGDAATAVPLWIAFLFARRRASAWFTYGFGRVEDVAGVLIVVIIMCSAGVAGYEAITRIMHPQPMALLGGVVAAGVIGFVGNEWVAVFRIRVGREIGSAALIAEHRHGHLSAHTHL